MSSGLTKRDPGDARTIEIDTDRVLGRRQEHFGVIDIGSNSIRLVVYDDLSRAPFPRFNEKSMCALGAEIDEDGNLKEEAMANAVHAIRRFGAIARAMDVSRVDVIATEATRRAKNGSDFMEAIREATGLDPRILTGEEEATYTAMGVISGFYQPKGLVGDIGGGSLEVAEVIGDRVGERLASMPLGAIPVGKMLEEGYGEAKKRIDDILSENLPPLLTEPVLYAVGGGWRALARVHIAMNNAPINVVQGYEVPAEDVRTLAKSIAKMTPEEVAALPDVPSRRIDTLAASALVMSRVLKALRPESVVFSAYGLREGWLYSQLEEEEKYRDPLLEGAQAIGIPRARVASFSAALAKWTDNLFPGETQADRRLRLAVCALSDMSWRDHAKVRGAESFRRLLQFPFIGVTHPERAFIATAVAARYGGKPDERDFPEGVKLLGDNQARRAEILGRALRLGYRFSASVPGILEQARLRLDADAARLEIIDSDGMPESGAVLDRLRQLGKSVGLTSAEIVEGEIEA